MDVLMDTGKQNVNGFQSRNYLLTGLYESLKVKATKLH
jgi:hypothetical protein